MPTLTITRLSLHAVAELLLAGPQFEVSGSIKLRVVPGGFATTSEPAVQILGSDIVVGDNAVPLDGRTVGAVAAEIGLAARQLDDVYSGGCGLTADHPLAVDPLAAAQIEDAFRIGDEALAALSPAAERVLWPEHFDLGISIGEVNYGISPGDSFLGVPYAYVGPWSPDSFSGSFWNAPFGAVRAMSELPGPGEVLEFLREGERLAAGPVS